MYGKWSNVAVTLGAMLFVVPQAFAQSANPLSVDVLSSKPQLVSGGSALVKVSGAASAPTVTVDGRDVSNAFKADNKGAWIALIEGLKQGDNRLVAKAGAGDASVTLKNHPINGALFAGPQQTPFLCENESHGLP